MSITQEKANCTFDDFLALRSSALLPLPEKIIIAQGKFAWKFLCGTLARITAS